MHIISARTAHQRLHGNINSLGTLSSLSQRTVVLRYVPRWTSCTVPSNFSRTPTFDVGPKWSL